jgi:uncharacterized protein
LHPNLGAFFNRRGAALAAFNDAADCLPGNVVSQLLPGNQPHIVRYSG